MAGNQRMSEAVWLACGEPKRLLEYLRRRKRPLSERKLRLFACACCRRVWASLDERGRELVEAAERFADGLVKWEELEEVRDRVFGADDPGPALWAAQPGIERGALLASNFAAWTAGWAAADVTGLPHTPRVGQGPVVQDAFDAELGAQAALVRDLAGNPFRVAEVDPSWLAWAGGTVPNLARGIYDERAFERLPVLADALEEAGCNHAEVLGHCRGGGEHMRGCWVLDLLLGKG